ncbi:MAG: glycerol-3-phosphate dehydrogenase, partial [Arthrobacter sp.]|nr:glycerol-3-phosphate dehydrogenase [Arthrobacter sp.]
MTAGEREAGSARSVAVLGAGSWGTTFAKILADAAAAAGDPRTIRLWGRRAEVVDQINTSHVNEQYLKDVPLPESISASTDVAAVLDGADLVVIAVPAQSLRPQLREWKGLIARDAMV